MEATIKAQTELENNCIPLLDIPDADEPSLAQLSSNHERFLRRMMGLECMLPPQLTQLDASHPWMVMWPVNALALLNKQLSETEIERIAESVLAYQNPTGGFGGGPNQPSHLAASYAAVMTLAHTNSTYWSRIKVDEMHEWILTLKNKDGSIKVCQHGESDPRATYCALAITKILGIQTQQITLNVCEYIKSCQTYEGGFANLPLGEAHGGYAFCSLASLFLIQGKDCVKFMNLPKFITWLVSRQDPIVGGFSGRANKLADGCYSYWVGGCWPIIEQILPNNARSQTHLHNYNIWVRKSLRDYIIKCCQVPNGGLRDKPGASPDAYHTNYCLAGLSCTQHVLKMHSMFQWEVLKSITYTEDELEIKAINPVFGIPIERAMEMHNFFISKKPSIFEYLGFSIYLGTFIAFTVYLLWAFLPDSWLKFVHVSYYPSRWWAITIPAFILSLLTYLAIMINAYNMEKLTPKPTSLATFTDKDTMVHDTPITEVNKIYKLK